MSQLLGNELLALRDAAVALRQKLEEARAHELPAFRADLGAHITALDETLALARIPDHYRVAVVGRFKVGKSSFVNAITGEALAGVRASPETAAISLFRYADSTYAEIEFVSREEWTELRAQYADDPDHPDVKRYAGFAEFNKKSEEEKIDLAGLEARWLKPGGYTHRIDAENWKTKDGKNQFKRELKQFTSSQDALHYLVKRLVIYAPIPLLGDNIELIDTPGLNDTERFRVRLTEEVVREVDAILFLTQSGASYSQDDKDFIVRQLRQRQIKHLQIIATKVDDTFEAEVRNAKENDEPEPTFEQFAQRERKRIQREVQATLAELLRSNALTDEEGYYYLEQLDAVPIHLISTRYLNDKLVEKSGIPAVQKKLYEVLSRSQRFEQSRKILFDRLKGITDRLRSSLSGRLNAIEADYNHAKVSQEIDKLRQEVQRRLDFFAGEAAQLVAAMAEEQSALDKFLPTHFDSAGLRADAVLLEFMATDLGKHFQTKRYSYWGNLGDLQQKIADRIFPTVETLLNHYIGQFTRFCEANAAKISHLEAEVAKVESDNALSGLDPLSLAQAHEKAVGQFKTMLADFATKERDSILKHLDAFVTAQVQTRLGTTKEKVSRVYGEGTVWRQNEVVRSFYDEVRDLLRTALREHLESKFKNFAAGLLQQARAVQPQLAAELLAVVDGRLKAIESSLNLSTEEQKAKVSRYLSDLLAVVPQLAGPPTVSEVSAAPATPSATVASSSPSAVIPPAGPEPQATTYDIPDGATGYGYERIFGPCLKGSMDVLVEDAHIRLRHQVANFQRFAALAVSAGCKKIVLKSGAKFGEDTDEADSALETIRRDLATNHNVKFEWSRSEKLHARKVASSNGWTVQIDRGLDIYYKPTSWASVGASDYNLRKCRQTTVTVLRATGAPRPPDPVHSQHFQNRPLTDR